MAISVIVKLPHVALISEISVENFLGGEKWPGIDCLRMRDHSQKNLGICLHLEIVIFVSLKDVAFCQLNYLQQYESRGQSACI